MDLYPAAKWICVRPPPKVTSADDEYTRFAAFVRARLAWIDAYIAAY